MWRSNSSLTLNAHMQTPPNSQTANFPASGRRERPMLGFGLYNAPSHFSTALFVLSAASLPASAASSTPLPLLSLAPAKPQLSHMPCLLDVWTKLGGERGENGPLKWVGPSQAGRLEMSSPLIPRGTETENKWSLTPLFCPGPGSDLPLLWSGGRGADDRCLAAELSGGALVQNPPCNLIHIETRPRMDEWSFYPLSEISRMLFYKPIYTLIFGV